MVCNYIYFSNLLHRYVFLFNRCIGTLFSPVKLCLRWILSIELGLNFRFCIWSFLGGRGGASIFILDEVIITKFQYESCLGELEKKVEIDIFYILNLLCFSKKCKNFTSWWAWKACYYLATLTSWILFIWFVFKTQLESFYTVDKQPYIYIYIHFWVLWCGWQTELATLTADFTIFLGKYPGQTDYLSVHRGWAKKKCTNVLKSGGNILGQSASKC